MRALLGYYLLGCVFSALILLIVIVIGMKLYGINTLNELRRDLDRFGVTWVNFVLPIALSWVFVVYALVEMADLVRCHR